MATSKAETRAIVGEMFSRAEQMLGPSLDTASGTHAR